MTVSRHAGGCLIPIKTTYLSITTEPNVNTNFMFFFFNLVMMSAMSVWLSRVSRVEGL